MAVSTCSDIYNEHEEYLVEMAPKTCTVDYEAGKKTCRYPALPKTKTSAQPTLDLLIDSTATVGTCARVLYVYVCVC